MISTEHSKLTGIYIDPKAGRQTFADYAAGRRACQVHRATTASLAQSNLKNHILPTFRLRPLAAIRPSEVQSRVKGRMAVLAPSTVETVYRYVAAILSAAVADKITVDTPCREHQVAEGGEGRGRPYGN